MTDIIVKDIKNGSEYYYGGSTEVSAEDVSYDNTTSGMTADNVQDAIDELKASVPTMVVVPHGTTEEIPENPTVGQMFYNTTDSQLLMYDGANWNSITKTTYHVSGDTITITYTEGSTSDFVVVYGDDAESWTQGDSRFDDFFWYKPVLLSAAGVETAELDPDDFTKDINGNAVNITSWDNVMIKFPIRGIKATKSGSDVTISLTKDANAEADGYSYYAFSRGTFDTPIKKDCFYIWAYEGYFSSNVMKSWSGKEPTCSKTHAQFMAAARANDGNTWDAWYEYEWFYQRDYINALYMLKYGNGDSQATFGQGIVNSSKHNTGTTNDKGMNYGTQSQTEAIKLFGIENYRGNCTEYVGGCCSDGNLNFYTALSHFTGDITTSGDYYKDSGVDVPSNTSWRQGRSKTAGTNKWIFVPIEANGTQYNDRFYGNASRLLRVSDYWDTSSHAGAFYFRLFGTASSSYSYDASRLMFL